MIVPWMSADAEARGLTVYDQTTFSSKKDGTHGDCFRASLCTLLQIDPETLPHPIGSDGNCWNGGFHKRLREMGWRVVTLTMDAEEASQPDLFFVYGGIKGVLPRVVLAAGLSERGIRHSVVWDRIAGRMLHDPHPSRAGLVSIDAIDIPIRLTPDRTTENATEGVS